MNEAAEGAFRDILLANSSLSALVGARVLWDAQEIDLSYPSVTLRILSTDLTNELDGRNAFRRALVEASGHAETRAGVSALVDQIISAFDSYASRATKTNVVFASILIVNVTESIPVREHSYRKSVIASVSFYE